MTRDGNKDADADEKDDVSAARRAALSPLLTPTDFRPLSATVRVEIGAHSRLGSDTLRNDDHYLVQRLSRTQETLATTLNAADLPHDFEEHGYAMLVADGIGESGAGSVASRLVLSTMAHLALHFGKWNLRIDPRTAAEVIDRAEWYYSRLDASLSVKRGTSPFLSGMATALTAVYSAGDDLFVAHVGHTRAYMFRDGALIQLTRDHTVKHFLADARRPALVEGRAQDLGHILTDALGASGAPPAVDVEQFRLVNGDCILLCTNGLTDAVSEDQIANVLTTRRRPADQCALLTELASRIEARDNITAVLAQYHVPAS